MQTPEQNTNPTPQGPVTKSDDTVRFKKSRLIWLGALTLIGFLLFFWHPFRSTPNFPEPKEKTPTYKRDEPARPQIFQSDYEEKIRDLINDGKTVGEISNETGVSRKEIRRIKKEMGKGDSDN